MPLSYQNVAEILKLIDSSNLDTVEIDIDGMHLIVRKGDKGQSNGSASAIVDTSDEPEPIEDDDEIPGGEHVSVGATTVRTDGAIEVRAPMMGTFYRAPSPSDPAYAEVGQTIQPGDALCLIEVMKLFTTLKAEQGGTIADIPAENGALVNQGDVLFVINPA